MATKKKDRTGFSLAPEIDNIVEWLNRHMIDIGKNTFVVGISGGIDSAVVERLCELAAHEMHGLKVLGISMPFTADNSDSEKRADELCMNRNNVIYYKIYISSIVQSYKARGVGQTQMNEGNLRSRIRTNILYDCAAQYNGLVIGTGNADEDGLGYCTKGGDGLCDIFPLSGIHKSDVYAIAYYMNIDGSFGIPESIYEAVPTAELWEGQTDEDELGMTYDQVEWALRILEQMSFDDALNNTIFPPKPEDIEILRKVDKMKRNNAHKFQVPPIYKPRWLK